MAIYYMKLIWNIWIFSSYFIVNSLFLQYKDKPINEL
jgi:hypothetical protein